MKKRLIRLINVPLALLLTLNLFMAGSALAQCSQWTTAPQTLCSNDPVLTLAGTPAPGVYFGPGVTGSTFNPAVAGAGTHDIGYSANSCTDTAFIQITVQLLPNITLVIPNSEKFVCEFDGPYAITGNNPNPGWPTSWFTGPSVDTLLGTFDPDPNNVGANPIVFHFDDGVCSGTAVDTIFVQDNPTASWSPFPDLCVTDGVLTLNQGSGMPTGGTFTYSGVGVSGSSPSFFFDPAVAGAGTHAITYCYTATNTCQTCVTQNINVYDVPNVTFIPPPALCENGGPIDLSMLGIGLPLGGYYQGPGIQSDSITLKPSQMGGPGSYTLTYTFVDTTGCSDDAQQTVTVNPKPVISITSNGPAFTPPNPSDPANILVKICEGDTAYTSITSTPTFSAPWPVIDPNSPSYWTNLGGVFAFHPPTDITFNLVIQATNGCTDTGSVTVDVIPPATADLTGPASICIGDSAILEVTGANTYNWLNPPSVTGSTVVVSPKANTTYQVVADSDVDGDGNQCSSDTGEITVYVDPLPLVTTGRDTTIFFGDETPLKAYGAQAFVWSEPFTGELSCYQCLSPIAKPLFQQDQLFPYRVYYVQGSDTNGCVNTDSIIVNLNPRIIVYVPTAFSPNGDGSNDELFVETKGVRTIDFEVYDRFGKTVFETKELGKGWDGSLDNGGEILPKDVYLYRLRATPYEEKVPPIDQAGQITLMR